MSSSRTTVTHVEPLAGHWLRVAFGDGAVHEVDLERLLHAGGVFASIRDDRDVFEAVSVDREFGTIVWPGASILIPTCSAATSRPLQDVCFRDESSSPPDAPRTI